MTNLETRPLELACPDPDQSAPSEVRDGVPADARADDVELLAPRDVPLGGLRAMTVRRTLPQRRRSFIGAWCFLDHYGPDDVAETGGMRVPPHPHTGLQTVSWLFSGEVEHRDSLGTHAIVRPGALNLMTAGYGIAHSEDSTATTQVLHGVQLWVVLPEQDREVDPTFEHHVPDVTPLPGAQLRVFLGSLAGVTSPVRMYSPLLGAELTLEAGVAVTFDVQPTHEHGVLVDTGAVTLVAGGRADGPRPGDPPTVPTVVGRSELAYASPGARTLTIRATDDAPARVVLLGGEPLGEQIVMWWNFIGRDHAEIERARAQWQAEIGADDGVVAAEGDATAGDTRLADLAAAQGVPPVPVHRPRGPRYGAVDGHPHAPLPAPPLPNQRLKPRG